MSMAGRLIARFTVFAVLLLAATLAHAQSQLYSTSAKEALLIDADTGTVLFAKEGSTPFPPASIAVTVSRINDVFPVPAPPRTMVTRSVE